MVTLAEVPTERYHADAEAGEIHRLLLVATTDAKLEPRREAAWELFRLARAPEFEFFAGEIDLETRLVLGAAAARQSGTDPAQEVSNFLSERLRGTSGKWDRLPQQLRFEVFRESLLPSVVPLRQTAARVLVRLWKEGVRSAGEAIIDNLRKGSPHVCAALVEALPDEVDAEVLDAVLSAARFHITPGSLKAFRLAFTASIYALAAAGLVDLALLAQWLQNQGEVNRVADLITWFTAPGFLGTIGLLMYRSFRMPIDYSRQGAYLEEIAAIVQASQVRLSSDQCRAMLPELQEFSKLMEFESKTISQGYQVAVGRLKESSKGHRAFPMPAEPPLASHEALPVAALDFD